MRDFQPAALNANPEFAIWTPIALPSVVPLGPLPAELAQPEFTMPLSALFAARISEADFVLRRHSEDFRAHAVDEIDGQPLAVNLAFDMLFEHRVSAALRLWRTVRGVLPGENVAALPPARRDRLILALRALDGRSDDASYRDIAKTLFGANGIPKRGWKTHDLRDRTIRLVRYGTSMMQGGYRHLLLYPFRRKI